MKSEVKPHVGKKNGAFGEKFNFFNVVKLQLDFLLGVTSRLVSSVYLQKSLRCPWMGTTAVTVLQLPGGLAAPQEQAAFSQQQILNPKLLPPFCLGVQKVYFKWPVPGRRLSTWIQVFPLSQPSLHLHVLTPPAASLVSCAIFFSSLGFSHLFACCVF